MRKGDGTIFSSRASPFRLERERLSAGRTARKIDDGNRLLACCSSISSMLEGAKPLAAAENARESQDSQPHVAGAIQPLSGIYKRIHDPRLSGTTNHDADNASQDPHRAHDVPQQHRGAGRLRRQLRADQAHPGRLRRVGAARPQPRPGAGRQRLHVRGRRHRRQPAQAAFRQPPSPPSRNSSPPTRWPSSPSPTTAQVVLPSTPLSEKAKIEDVIQKVDMFDVDPGGTAMDQGISPAWREVEKNVGAGKLSQLIVLTDGETSGEQICRQLAQAGRPEEDPLQHHRRRHRMEPEPHQGPGQAGRGRLGLHRRQRRRPPPSASSSRSSSPGRGRLPQRRDAPSRHEGRQGQARPHGRAGDQGADR